LAELAPEDEVLLRLALGELLQALQDLPGELLLDLGEGLVLLQHLARDVEREVLRVGDAAEEAQVSRGELLAVLDDEDALGVEAEALAVALEEVGRGLLGDVQEGVELDWRVD